MGFDSIELIIQVEKAFCIKLPDKRLEKTRTVGELHILILEAIDSPSMASADQVCRKCSYNLRGLKDPRCPECGTSFIFRGQVPSEKAWDMLVAIIGELVGLAPGDVRPELNFVTDFI